MNETWNSSIFKEIKQYVRNWKTETKGNWKKFFPSLY